MRRVRAGLLLAAAIVAATLAVACSADSIIGGGSSSGNSLPTGFDPKTATTWFIAVDLSQSTIPYRQDYVKAVAEIAKNMQPGDRLVVMSVEKTAVSNARYLYETQFSHFAFTPSPTPTVDNKLVQDKFAAGETKRYKDEQRAWDAAHDLPAEVEKAVAKVRMPILKTRSSPSDLFGAVYLAGQVFSSAKGPRRLVLLTDGLVNYGNVNWQHKAVTPAMVKSAIAGERKNGALPRLRGAKVIVIGANADSSGEFASLARAWQKYVRAAGGELRNQDFMRNLEIFRLDEWLNDN